MKNIDYLCQEEIKERECCIRGVCGRDIPVRSLKEVTLFGLQILSKGNTSKM